MNISKIKGSEMKNPGYKDSIDSDLEGASVGIPGIPAADSYPKLKRKSKNMCL